MAGALGLLTGVGLGAAAGFAKQQRQKKEQHDSALFDFYSKNPQLVADSPEAQSFIKGYAGKDASTAFITMANHVKQASQMFGQQLAGGGGGASGAAGALPAAGQAAPSSPTDLRDHISKIEAFMASPDAQYLTPNQMSVAQSHLADLRKQAETQQQQGFKEREFQQKEKDIAERQQEHILEFQSNQQLRRELAGQSNALRQEMAGLHDQDQKNNFATRMTDQLSKQSDALIRQFSDPNKTYDQKTRQAAVNNWNRHVQSVFDSAERQGIDLGDADAYRLDVGPESAGVMGYFKKPGGIQPAAPTATEPASATETPTKSKSGRPVAMGPDGKLHYVE